MNEVELFLEAHADIEAIRRKNIADYWEEDQKEDIVAKFSMRQRHHLLSIHRYGPCSLQTLMQHTGLSSSAVSAAVDKLVKAKVVRRVQNKENRREVRVSVIPALKEHLDEIDKRFRGKVASIFANFSTDENAAVLKSSEALLKRTRANGKTVEGI